MTSRVKCGITNLLFIHYCIHYFIPHFIMDVIIYPCWDQSQTMIVKGAPGIIIRCSNRSSFCREEKLGMIVGTVRASNLYLIRPLHPFVWGCYGGMAAVVALLLYFTLEHGSKSPMFHYPINFLGGLFGKGLCWRLYLKEKNNALHYACFHNSSLSL